MIRRALVLMVAVAGLSPAVNAAAPIEKATLPLHRLRAQVASDVLTDDRYAVFSAVGDEPHTIRVLDTLTRRTTMLRIPPECDWYYAGELHPARTLLLNCRTPTVDGRLRLMRIPDGATTVVPVNTVPERQSDVMQSTFDDVGRYWIGGVYGDSDPHAVQTIVYVNRFTGEVRHYFDEGRDADSPNLGPISKYACGTKRELVEPYRPPYGVVPGGRIGFRLVRCTAPRRYVDIPCSRCVDPELWAGVLTWHDAGPLRAYLIRTRTIYTWRLHVPAAYFYATRYAVLIDTARGLFVAWLPKP